MFADSTKYVLQIQPNLEEEKTERHADAQSDSSPLILSFLILLSAFLKVFPHLSLPHRSHILI